MQTLNEIALEAFKIGSDNFGETIVDISDKLEYVLHKNNSIYLTQPNNLTHDVYYKKVLLKNADGSSSSSNVGFYVKDGVFSVRSGHFVFNDIVITPEIVKEFKNAHIVFI
jgi:hypothetical protein